MISEESTAMVYFEKEAPPTKDLLAVTKFRNLPLHRLIPARCQGRTAERMGCSTNTLSGFLTLRTSPFKKDGSYKAEALRAADYFCVLPEDIFPFDLYQLNLPHAVERVFSSGQVLSMLEARQLRLLPERQEETLTEAVAQLEMTENTNKALSVFLDEREQSVIKMRFGIGYDSESTLDEIAAHQGCSKSRISQIEQKALRKLRSFKANRTLGPFLDIKHEAPVVKHKAHAVKKAPPDDIGQAQDMSELLAHTDFSVLWSNYSQALRDKIIRYLSENKMYLGSAFALYKSHPGLFREFTVKMPKKLRRRRVRRKKRSK